MNKIIIVFRFYKMSRFILTMFWATPPWKHERTYAHMIPTARCSSRTDGPSAQPNRWSERSSLCYTYEFVTLLYICMSRTHACSICLRPEHMCLKSVSLTDVPGWGSKHGQNNEFLRMVLPTPLREISTFEGWHFWPLEQSETSFGRIKAPLRFLDLKHKA